jgi:integrase
MSVNNAVAAAKLDDVNFHTLRHTFASWAVMRGVTPKSCRSFWVMPRWP